MSRAFTFLLRNWPLKLAAILLATLLYSGLVLSQNTQVFGESVPITIVGERPDVQLLSNVGNVDRIRYSAPPTVRVDSSRFEATIDLSDVEPTDNPVSVPVDVRALDPRILILEVEPARIDVLLARVSTKSVRVVVLPGVVPPGLQIAAPVADPGTVEVRAAEPVLAQVVEVHALVQVEPSGLDFDRDVELIPVDSLGEQVLSVEVSPPTGRVTIDVFTDSDTRTLPINPTITGTPEAGFEIAGVVVVPLVVTVSGSAEQLAAMAAVDTEPISVSGRRESVEANVGLQLPEGVTSLAAEIQVTITMRRVTESRTVGAGIVLLGARSDRTYTLSTDRVLVTLSGSAAELAGLAVGTLVVNADVGALDTGEHEVALTTTLPSGVTLLSISPATVAVSIGQPASPATSPSAGP